MLLSNHAWHLTTTANFSNLGISTTPPSRLARLLFDGAAKTVRVVTAPASQYRRIHAWGGICTAKIRRKHEAIKCALTLNSRQNPCRLRFVPGSSGSRVVGWQKTSDAKASQPGRLLFQRGSLPATARYSNDLLRGKWMLHRFGWLSSHVIRRTKQFTRHNKLKSYLTSAHARSPSRLQGFPRLMTLLVSFLTLSGKGPTGGVRRPLTISDGPRSSLSRFLLGGLRRSRAVKRGPVSNRILAHHDRHRNSLSPDRGHALKGSAS